MSESGLRILNDMERSNEQPYRVSIVLSTYKRPDMLRKCLDSLLKQALQPIEICVGRRKNDLESAKVLSDFSSQSAGLIREAVVGENANLVASMNAALSKSTGDLVALTDDDVEAPSDWLKKFPDYFNSLSVGGVGGRDWQPAERWSESEVGILKWWGKVVGNHHLGVGPARDVDLLKGVNCCFRGDLIRSIGFDKRLKGKGNVSHWEMHLCFALRRQGWRLIYDPAVKLDHHVAVRVDGDINARGGFARESFEDGVHNGALALINHLKGSQKQLFQIWQFLIGTSAEPGIAQTFRLCLRGVPISVVFNKYLATRAGFKAAKSTWKNSVCDSSVVKIIGYPANDYQESDGEIS